MLSFVSVWLSHFYKGKMKHFQTSVSINQFKLMKGDQLHNLVFYMDTIKKRNEINKPKIKTAVFFSPLNYITPFDKKGCGLSTQESWSHNFRRSKCIHAWGADPRMEMVMIVKMKNEKVMVMSLVTAMEVIPTTSELSTYSPALCVFLHAEV